MNWPIPIPTWENEKHFVGLKVYRDNMSFFGGGNNNGPSVNDGAVKQAKIETEVLTDMFNK